MDKKTKNSEGCLTISLFDPGMTALHKAGLAGLWMTLEAVENDDGLRRRLEVHGSWERDKSSVSLSWNDEKAFFGELFAISFGIRNGLFYFPAIGDPSQHPQHAVVLQEAVLGTVLQHGKTRKADKSDKPEGNISAEIDDGFILLKYHKVFAYAHQKADFKAGAMNKLVGWLYPGGGGRHMGLGKSTDLDNPPGLALALRYLIVGAIYFEIRRRGGGVRPRYAMVIPDINDLDAYSKARKVFLKHGVKQLTAAGAAEAGLRVLAELEARNVIEDLGATGCRVFSFGTVPWSPQQKTKVEVFEVRLADAEGLRSFRTAQQVFEAKWKRSDKGEPFLSVSQTPELIARNVVEGRPWWRGFSDFVADQERRKHIFEYEKGGLAKMVEDKRTFPDGPERIFVEACQEAWRHIAGQIGTRTKEKGTLFNAKIANEKTKIIMALLRCKNPESVREEVMRFWAKAGVSLASLQERWYEILGLFSKNRWKEARDLALLAIISYGKKEEANSPGDVPEEKKGGENG